MRLQGNAKKIREFLLSSEERLGTQGKAVKSNVTDNKSAKMLSSHEVVQLYTGIATVDAITIMDGSLQVAHSIIRIPISRLTGHRFA